MDRENVKKFRWEKSVLYQTKSTNPKRMMFVFLRFKF